MGAVSPSERVPVACSLDAEGVAERRAEALELLRAGLAERTVEEDGSLALVFRGEAALRADVRDLVRREKECCPFFEFDLVEHGEELTVVARAPAEAQELLERLFSLN